MDPFSSVLAVASWFSDTGVLFLFHLSVSSPDHDNLSTDRICTHCASLSASFLAREWAICKLAVNRSVSDEDS